jgi:hypothetical protein
MSMIYIDSHHPEKSNWFSSEVAKAGRFATLLHGNENGDGNVVTILMRHEDYVQKIEKNTLPRPQDLQAARVSPVTGAIRRWFPHYNFHNQTEAILLWDAEDAPFLLAFIEDTWISGIMPDYNAPGAIKCVRIVTERGVQTSTQQVRTIATDE